MTDSERNKSQGSGMPARVVCETRAVLGEGPVYLAREESVYWVDIKGQLVHRLNL